MVQMDLQMETQTGVMAQVIAEQSTVDRLTTLLFSNRNGKHNQIHAILIRETIAFLGTQHHPRPTFKLLLPLPTKGHHPKRIGQTIDMKTATHPLGSAL